MKGRAALIAAALAAAAPAYAQDGVQFMAGAWECRLPEHAGSRTPPILYIGAAKSGDAMRTDLVEVDGFARAVSGMAKVAAAEGGWTQVTPEAGPPFFARAESGTAQAGKTAAMTVKRSEAGAAYRCLRLPYPKI